MWETEPAPRPGTLEARACLKKIGQSPVDYPDYRIRYCTNTGVWVVDHCDPMTGLALETYDFVNKEFQGPETNGQPEEVSLLGAEKVSDFWALQKMLNADLLNDKKKEVDNGPSVVPDLLGFMGF